MVRRNISCDFSVSIIKSKYMRRHHYSTATFFDDEQSEWINSIMYFSKYIEYLNSLFWEVFGKQGQNN